MSGIPIEAVVYAAGFFDGEGCVGIYRRKMPASTRPHSVSIRIINTNPLPLQFIQKNFGGSIGAHRPKNPEFNRKPTWQWRIGGEAGYEFLRSILPFLIVKAREVELCIAFRDLKKRCGGRATMERITPENLKSRIKFAYEVASLKKRAWAELPS